MANQFNSIFTRLPKYNKFKLSHESRLTCGIGQLVPVLTQDILPGDKIDLRVENLVKFQPMIAPIMQRVDVFFHAYYVPNRLVWPHWEQFITGYNEHEFSTIPTDDLTQPYFIADARSTKSLLGAGSLFDYLDIPTYDQTREIGQNVKLPALPICVYNKIWSDYYRDQNLEDPVDPLTMFGYSGSPISARNSVLPVAIDDSVMSGSANTGLKRFFRLRQRCYSKDYFTSALPEPQRGPDVVMPIDAVGTLSFNPQSDQGNKVVVHNNNFNTVSDLAVDTESHLSIENPSGSVGTGVHVDNSKDLSVNIQGTSATIADFRRGFKVQEWQEKLQRGGARYNEVLLNFFGVRSSDARLQRSEYLGGCKAPVIVSQITQTSQTSVDESDPSALGSWAGNATSLSSNTLCRRTFEEHGTLMVIMSIMPKASYFQGMPRKYLKNNRFDFYWPQFAHIGEQEIQNQELFFDYTDTTGQNSAGFGYSPRYAEYRFNLDKIHGDFRDTLDYWHMARKFASLPPLNADFMKVRNSDLDRVFSVNVDKANPCLVQLFFDMKGKRKVSRYGNPRL